MKKTILLLSAIVLSGCTVVSLKPQENGTSIRYFQLFQEKSLRVNRTGDNVSVDYSTTPRGHEEIVQAAIDAYLSRLDFGLSKILAAAELKKEQLNIEKANTTSE